MDSDPAGSGLPWIDAIVGAFAPVPFAAFHRRQLPELIARNGQLVDADLREAPPIAFRAGCEAFTWAAGPDGLRVIDGDADAASVAELSPATFSEFILELLTASGAMMTGRMHMARGSLHGLQRWEPAIRALCSGRPIYGAAARETLRDRAGEPLDLKRRFGADSDADEMRHFLLTAGYLHVRGVFVADEIARYGAEVEHARALSTPDDQFSWWSVDASGREVLTRINYLGRFSRVLQDLARDERLQRFARLAGPDLRVCDDRLDGPMVFIKNPRVVKGNGDLGWHVDDGIGGHPVMCPLIQAGVQLDHADEANGQLKVLAGSHRYCCHWLAWGDEGELPVVALDTEPGDLTLHFGDTMHTTPPPTSHHAGRRALYYKFAEPKTFDFVPAQCHYNDALFRADASGRRINRATTWGEKTTQ